MRWLFVFLLALPFIGLSQNINADYQSDTSFTVNSAYKKAVKTYPQITTVKYFSDLDIEANWDIIYYSIGKRDLHADVFYPKQISNEKHPGALLIHGGGWASGNKSHLVPMAQKLATAGYIAASVEYRLSPEAKYPASIVDLKTAVKWFKIYAENYGLDTSKIAVLGTSAGATLATLLGATWNTPLFTSHPGFEAVSGKHQAIVNMDGVLDFTDPAEFSMVRFSA